MTHYQDLTSDTTTEPHETRLLSTADSFSSSSIKTLRATEYTKASGGFLDVGTGNSTRRGSDFAGTSEARAMQVQSSNGYATHTQGTLSGSDQNEAGGRREWQDSKSKNGADKGYERLDGANEKNGADKLSNGMQHDQQLKTFYLASPIAQQNGYTNPRDQGLKQSERLGKRDLRRNGSVNNPNRDVSSEASYSIPEREKKIMLSKALQRANDAVLLDNSQSYDDAMSAYDEACGLLLHVMGRTAGEDDKLKLSAIRNTYANRVLELQRLGSTAANSTILGRSTGNSSTEISLHGSNGTVDYGDMSPVLTNAVNRATSVTRSTRSVSFSSEAGKPLNRARSAIPVQSSFQRQPSFSSPNARLNGSGHDYPWTLDSDSNSSSRAPEMERYISAQSSHTTGGQAENVNLLDEAPVIDYVRKLQLSRSNSISKHNWHESGRPTGSPHSSPHHSISSYDGLHRKRLHTRAESGATEAAFDAALDAAVEAAYGEGYEPYDDSIVDDLTTSSGPRDSKLDPRVQTTLPRGSDSSSFSNATFGSSINSNMTAGTSLSTVDEGLSMAVPGARKPQYINVYSANGAPAPPPQGPLPLPPSLQFSPTRAVNGHSHLESSNVRARRGPGMNPRKLTIETMVAPASEVNPYSADNSSSSSITRSQYASPVTPEKMNGKILRSERVVYLASSPQSTSPQGVTRQISPSLVLGSPLGQTQGRSQASNLSPEGNARSTPQSGSPANNSFVGRPFDRSSAKKNLSSLSLKHKPVLMPTNEDAQASQSAFMDGAFASAPSSATRPLAGSSYIPATVMARTPPPQSHAEYFQDATQPGPVSRKSAQSMPRPLEPCPEQPLLRPFWLMRCLYEVAAHPKGGYLSTKLFVPREVWRMKNVKLKHVEEKVNNLELLTDALLRLGALNLLDSDAILREMQSLENVLDQVQASLARRLGSDVGPHTVSTMFKEATGPETVPGSAIEANFKEHKSSGKSMWRKLRGKSTSMSESLGMSSVSSKDVHQGDPFHMSSVPLTPIIGVVSQRFASRGAPVAKMRGEGPHASYMTAIAKLCYAVQVLDQIARQVADPDLKHSSPTRVGLQLSVRHAAEFFGFYVCRFILQDITILVNKLLKRSTEWVLV